MIKKLVSETDILMILSLIYWNKFNKNNNMVLIK